jgi:hypothetical protein
VVFISDQGNKILIFVCYLQKDTKLTHNGNKFIGRQISGLTEMRSSTVYRTNSSEDGKLISLRLGGNYNKLKLNIFNFLKTGLAYK